MAIEPPPTPSAIWVPASTRLKTSRPRLSVPKIWLKAACLPSPPSNKAVGVGGMKRSDTLILYGL